MVMKDKTDEDPVCRRSAPISPSEASRVIPEDLGKTRNPAEEELSRRIFEGDHGQGLIRFCRELSAIMIRRYMVERDVGALRDRFRASLVTTLKCTESQALCLVELTLELIHARLHGTYRRSPVELSYLIGVATGAVRNLSVN